VLQRRADGALVRQRSILVSVEMRTGERIGRFDRHVRAAVEQLGPRLPDGVEITTVSDQPRSVDLRLRRFGRCFLEAVGVILLVAVLLMEARAALIVALSIPLTVALTFAGMATAGIPLHQVSVAALIIALGMLVDDPVVAVDGINREMAAGTPRPIAAWLGPWNLRRPILFATLINIFAFLPLLLLPGDKKSFIHALPVVVSLSLVASRLVSMTFVPLLGRHLLRGQAGFDRTVNPRPLPLGLVDRALGWLLRPYRAALQWALRHPWPVLAVAYGLLAASLTLAPRLGSQFFPPAERSQCLIDLTLPDGSSLTQTRRVCDAVMRILEPHTEVVSGAVFIGGSAPRFYYNVTPKAPADHLAQFLLTTRNEEEVPPLVTTLRAAVEREITGARCVVRRLEQGPPVEAPIYIRFVGDDRNVLRGLTDQASAILQRAGAHTVADTLGSPIPALNIALDPTRAARHGLIPESLALALQAAGPGLEVGRLPGDTATIPVRLRLQSDEGAPFSSLEDLPLEGADGSLVPLSEVASVQTTRQFAARHRHGGRPSVAIEAHAQDGDLPAAVLARARPALDRLAIPDGYRLSYEGEARELTESRSEMATVMAVSLGLIALTLIVQFRSIAQSLVVLLTVPLGMIGALVGLTIAREPMGFMAMLAAVSLAGVIVSHIIVLSDAVEEARAGGLGVHDALISAGLSRLRPVLVTTLATAGGLVPLALTGGALWRPLAAVHIAGLLLATGLTLIVLPVWYSLVTRTSTSKSPSRRSH
jgi:multidrug efflux pump subunit AcrB